jgi:tRNA(fMet)-specific endonuclease VapC
MHTKTRHEFIDIINVIPILNVLDSYVSERIRLEKTGNRIDDFDLLIGVTAIANELILVTNNTKHLQRMKLKNIEDWTI